MLSTYYRSFAAEKDSITEFLKILTYVLEYTITTGKNGGRGSFFKNLITERLPRKIQETCGSVLLRFIKATTDNTLEDDIVRKIYEENKPFSIKTFYENMEPISEESQDVLKLQDYNIGPSLLECLNSSGVELENITVNTNIFTPTWSKELFPKYRDLASAWEPRENGGVRLATHAPSKLKDLIVSKIHPEKNTIFLLLTIYKEIGFILDNSIDPRLSIYDVIGPRLEAFCRVYLGSVLKAYFSLNKDKKLTKRTSVMSALEKELMMYRGTHNSTKLGVVRPKPPGKYTLFELFLHYFY